MTGEIDTAPAILPAYMRYVVGLAFTEDGNQVVLLEKDHPEWQRGRWNGPGGKVKMDRGIPLESVEQAVSREFEEETGVAILPFEWSKFLVLEGDWYGCTFLRTFHPSVAEARTMETEKVALFSTSRAWGSIPTIPNLSWIIPLALDQGLRVPIRMYNPVPGT